jgi:hypothetical protein
MRVPDYNDEAAKAAHCWFAVDHVPGDPETTAWKRHARWKQAQWREQHGSPIGAEPYKGGHGSTPVGSRVALDFAKANAANFLTPAVVAAVRAREGAPETYQTLSSARLWADLLSSMPLCFNLFGDLAGDEDAAAQAVQAWWPYVPKGRVSVRFEHSPGRRDPGFLGNQSAFDAAFEIDMGQSLYIIGVETKYHEHAQREEEPKGEAMRMYAEVTERSGAFVSNWRERLVGTELQQIWLDHLLLLSMLQHEPTSQHPKRWMGGRFVLVYPAGNPSFARVAKTYADVLRDPSTFEARTLEDLLRTPGALAESSVRGLAERYL